MDKNQEQAQHGVDGVGDCRLVRTYRTGRSGSVAFLGRASLKRLCNYFVNALFKKDWEGACSFKLIRGGGADDVIILSTTCAL